MPDNSDRVYSIVDINNLLIMVSVIMNTINEKPELLKRAIDSYLMQKNCELILSTVEDDPSISLISNRNPNVKIVTIPREGHPYFTKGKLPRGSFLQLNNGLKHITGDWYTFASSNDYSYPNKLMLEVAHCKAYKKEVCYSAYDYEYENGKKSTQLFHKYNWDKHSRSNFVADCSLISRRLVDRYLPFNTDLNNYAYWDLWLRIRKIEGDVFCYNPTPTWAYIQDRDSMHVKRSKDPVKKQQAIIDRERMLSLHR